MIISNRRNAITSPISRTELSDLVQVIRSPPVDFSVEWMSRRPDFRRTLHDSASNGTGKQTMVGKKQTKNISANILVIGTNPERTPILTYANETHSSQASM